MSPAARPVSFWIFVVFLALSIVVLVAGQTLAVIDYDLAVRLGLQESVGEVSAFGVQINRAFGAGDTAVYIPLIAVSLVGLIRGRRWSLTTTAAVAGISIYWSVTVSFIFFFLPGVPGYNHVPSPAIWIFVGTYAAFGSWALLYLSRWGDRLLR